MRAHDTLHAHMGGSQRWTRVGRHAFIISSIPFNASPLTPDRFDDQADTAVYIMEEGLVIVPAPFNVTITTAASKPRERRWQW